MTFIWSDHSMISSLLTPFIRRSFIYLFDIDGVDVPIDPGDLMLLCWCWHWVIRCYYCYWEANDILNDLFGIVVVIDWWQAIRPLHCLMEIWSADHSPIPLSHLMTDADLTVDEFDHSGDRCCYCSLLLAQALVPTFIWSVLLTFDVVDDDFICCCSLLLVMIPFVVVPILGDGVDHSLLFVDIDRYTFVDRCYVVVVGYIVIRCWLVLLLLLYIDGDIIVGSIHLTRWPLLIVDCCWLLSQSVSTSLLTPLITCC